MSTYDPDPSIRRIRVLVVTFRPPAGRYVTTCPEFCDQYGSVMDLIVNGNRWFTEESPLIVQPDYLVDTSTQKVVGLTFELTDPSWMLPRCQEMLQGLDPRAIRVARSASNADGVTDDSLSLEVLWSKTESYHNQFGQLDYGLWAFLYKTPNPVLFHDGKWTPPEALVIGDIEQYGWSVALEGNEFSKVTVSDQRNPP